IHAAALFCDEENPCEPPFLAELLRSLFLHGRFVFAHREWNPVARGNHYLSCVVGLLHLGALFSRHPEGARWLAFARRELFREMREQVGSDGVAHEGSSGYHTFLTELFLHSALLLARLDADAAAKQPISRTVLEKSCGQSFTAQLGSMFAFLAALTAGRERPPVLGDSDDGRLLSCCSVYAAPAHHLLAIGAELFARHDWPAHHTCEEVFWALGHPPHPENKTTNSGANSSAFRKSGFFFFASERIRGSIRCGPLGVKGWANHAHCDQLSVEFCFDGRPVLVDPGTYLYSGDAQARNEFRSSRAHNSVVVAGAEQNRFWPGLLFRMIDDTRSRPRAWRAGPHFVEFHGEHFGYRRLRHRVKVARGVRLDRRKHALEIFDYLTGSGSATLEWHFHFAPSIEVAPMSIDNLPTQTKSAEPWGAAVMVKGATPKISIRAQWKVGPLRLTISIDRVEHFESALESGWVSSRYSHREKSPVLVIRCRGKFPVVAEFLFEPIEKR
ncbi:MAG TPA: alginate lyase family protein, partial [Candidatus Nitrosotenuis sp.]|nr:alginate lyase family protein [Candidatus Nitrosotenuis sp.]